MDMTTTKALVLNRGYYPIGVCTLRDAFKLIAQDVAVILDAKLQPFDYTSWASLEVEEGMDSIGTVHGRIRAPRVIRLVTFDKVPNTVVRFSRQNVMQRDYFTCCYCGKKKHVKNLSLDHVVPRAHGGKTEWGNVVTSCMTCNGEKAARTPEQAGMPLLRRPHRPTWSQLHLLGAAGKMRPEWEPFLAKFK